MRGVLWLASYPVRCDWPNTSSMWRKCYAYLPYCDAVSRHITNKAFVASSGDVITDYNDLELSFFHVMLHRATET